MRTVSGSLKTPARHRSANGGLGIPLAVSVLCAAAAWTSTSTANASSLGLDTLVDVDAPPAGDPTAEPTPTPGKTDPSVDPTSAPGRLPGGTPDPAAEGPKVEEPAAPEPEPIAEPEPEPAKVGPERGSKNGPFARHAIGVRANMVILPSYILSPYVASQGGALCRKDPGNALDKYGMTKTDGCNFYVGGEYIYRKSRNLDIVAGFGYQRMRLPDAYFIDNSEVVEQGSVGALAGLPLGSPDLTAADYTEIDVSFLSLEADFIGRAAIVTKPDFEFDLGGGAGIGILGIIGPGVFQSGLGTNIPQNGIGAGTCRTIADLADFRRCTPAWYDDDEVDEDKDGQNTGDVPPAADPDLGLRADCDQDKCKSDRLEELGIRRKADIPSPVWPVVNLIVSARFLIKDSFGINITGGWSTGFYFGGGMHYYFGPK